MDYILQNEDYYRDFISPETVEEYTINKKQDGVWGDSLEMCVFAQIFQINIFIYFYDDHPSNVLKPQTQDNNNLREWRNVIYTKCLEVDNSIQQFLIDFESSRTLNNTPIAFSLLYKNGNHYDALYSMNREEYIETINSYLINVIIY